MLDIDIRPYKGVLMVRLKGKINKKTLPKLKNEVSQLTKIVGVKNLVFNITELTEINLEGICELSKNCNYCISNNGNALFVLENENKYLKNYFKDTIEDENKALLKFL